MTPQKRDKAYLTHILESIALVPRHMQRTERNTAWHEDETVREAVLRTLQTMSESCAKLSRETCLLAPEMDWKKIAGFRNILAHDYLGDIDYDRVTEVIEQHAAIENIHRSNI